MTPSNDGQVLSGERVKPLDGALKVWWMPQMGHGLPDFECPVESVVEGKLLMDALAQYDLYQFKNKIKPDYANMGGLSVYRNGDWEEWEDADCDDIDQYTLAGIRAAIAKATGA